MATELGTLLSPCTSLNVLWVHTTGAYSRRTTEGIWKSYLVSHVQATKCHLFQNKHNRSKRTSMNKRNQRSLALHIFWQVRQDSPVIKTYLLHFALWLVQKTCAIFSTNETPDEHHLWPNHPCFPPLLVVCPTVLANNWPQRLFWFRLFDSQFIIALKFFQC